MDDKTQQILERVAEGVWCQPNRHETIYYRIYSLKWFGYKFEILKEINYEEWVKIK